MTIFDAMLLGIVEGITEFLPVSSTGHLILASKLLGMASSEFLKSFEIAIQLGAILAVVVLYFRSFLNMAVLKKIIAAFIPTGIIGFVLYKFIKGYLLDNTAVVLWALFIGGVMMILFELFQKKSAENALPDAAPGVSAISYRQAISIGVFQSLAVVPGVSRSAATIVGGMIMGISRVAIVEFSFLLAVPTMLAATVLDISKNVSTFSMNDAAALSVGFLVSFAVAIVSIKFLLKFVRTNTFIPFGVYRMAIAAAFWLLLFR